jgi:hypothetical protein
MEFDRKLVCLHKIINCFECERDFLILQNQELKAEVERLLSVNKRQFDGGLEMNNLARKALEERDQFRADWQALELKLNEANQVIEQILAFLQFDQPNGNGDLGGLISRLFNIANKSILPRSGNDL